MFNWEVIFIKTSTKGSWSNSIIRTHNFIIFYSKIINIVVIDSCISLILSNHLYLSRNPYNIIVYNLLYFNQISFSIIISYYVRYSPSYHISVNPTIILMRLLYLLITNSDFKLEILIKSLNISEISLMPTLISPDFYLIRFFLYFSGIIFLHCSNIILRLIYCRIQNFLK